MSVQTADAEERFRELFPNAEPWFDEHRERELGLVDEDSVVMLLYDDTIRVGVIDTDRLDEQPDAMNYTVGTKDGETVELWCARKERRFDKSDITHYYQDQYVSRVAELLGVAPASIGEYCYTRWDKYDGYPALFEHDGIRVLVSPYLIGEETDV